MDPETGSSGVSSCDAAAGGARRIELFQQSREVVNIPNDLLQGRFSQAANDSGRLLINTTVGLAGVLDVAHGWGLERSEGEDFGQTLAVWGVPSGSYVVLPFMGGTTLRDLPGSMLDAALFDPLGGVSSRTKTGLEVLEVVDQRASFLEAEQLISGDDYAFLKSAYLQNRAYQIANGEQDDDFVGEDEEF